MFLLASLATITSISFLFILSVTVLAVAAVSSSLQEMGTLHGLLARVELMHAANSPLFGQQWVQ